MSGPIDNDVRRVVRDARILMIDDEPLNTDVLRIHLEAEGYRRFSVVSDARLALETIAREMPDVLLLDLLMPEVSGFEILTAMQADAALAQIPVIVLTSSNDAATKLQALELGATDFLAKPVDASELALRMRNTLSARAWQLRHSRLDKLTELPNKQCFVHLLERELESAVPDRSLGLLVLVNINQFKAINDSLGMARGDEVLWLLRERLIAIFGRNPSEVIDSLSLGPRPGAVCVARIGADRFAIYLPESGSEGSTDSAVVLIRQFASSFSAPVVIDSTRLVLTLSIGISRLGIDGDDVGATLNAAETAMGQSRESGDGGFRFYAGEMDARARDRLNMQSGLRTAIEDGGIFLTYQPKIDVATGRICGAEALVRWQHPEFGLISPVDFIPMAEDSGDIVAIGDWVLQEACRQAIRWQPKGRTRFHMAVNVSIRQLCESNFNDRVLRAIEQTGIEPQTLVIELTENIIMENAESNVGKLEQLRALGVSIAIDDFGTGYSSLAYLQRFPITQLKIDQSFVREIQAPDDKVPIIKAVISLAHDLGLQVVAEGVETPEQLERLRTLKCEQYQGYLASRPVMADEFTRLLAASELASLAA